MPEFSDSVLAVTDDAYDRERASDGRSRYGAYLAARADQLLDDGAPMDAASFAVAAWRIATSPVMAPGYVRVRPDLAALTPTVADNYRMMLHFEVPLRHRALATRPARVQDWSAHRPVWGDERWQCLTEPDPEYPGRPALLVTATLLVSVPAEILTSPSACGPGPVMTRGGGGGRGRGAGGPPNPAPPPPPPTPPGGDKQKKKT
ncbi:hypothetical protein ACFWXO_41965, partial [Kitasatospora sp. NPDC059088]|uniref:hypothetical protein n=1 Tax=Kitasatospora sp. NPDC059088 TaxID=3346722 RepID=UPI0036804FC9